MIFSPLLNMSDAVCLISSSVPLLLLLLLSQFRPSEVLRAVRQPSQPFFGTFLVFGLMWTLPFVFGTCSFFPPCLVDGGCCSRTDRPIALSEKQQQAGGAALYVLGKDFTLCNNGLLLWGSFDHFLCFLFSSRMSEIQPRLRGFLSLSLFACVRALDLKRHVKSQYWITCCSLCVQLELHLRQTDEAEHDQPLHTTPPSNASHLGLFDFDTQAFVEVMSMW